MLKDLADERIGRIMEEHERRLEKDLTNLRAQSFGLGTESITAVAGLELSREEILTEKKYFEKFMDILIPGSISRKKRLETEKMLAELEKAQEAPPSAEEPEKKQE
jgi:hypothetical protein